MKNAFKKVAVVIVALMLFLLCSCSNVSETQVSTTAASTRSSNFKAPDFPENMEHEPPQGMGFDILRIFSKRVITQFSTIPSKVHTYTGQRKTTPDQT